MIFKIFNKMQSYYGNWEGANPVFRWANCYQQVTHDEQGWDAAYCTEVLLVSVLSGVNCGLLIFLTYADIEKQKGKAELTWK